MAQATVDMHDITVAVKPGASLEQTSALKRECEVSCEVETENWTKHHLTSPVCSVESGQILIPPFPVKPGEKEALLGCKTSFSLYGTAGVVSWLIGGEQRRLVVMWSIPFSQWFHSSYLAVGLTDVGQTNHNRKWYRQMNDDKNHHDEGLKFVKGKYDKQTQMIRLEDTMFSIEGNMGTTVKTKAEIVLKPTHIHVNNLAKSVSVNCGN